MKRLLAMVLATGLLMPLALGCGGDDTTKPKTGADKGKTGAAATGDKDKKMDDKKGGGAAPAPSAPATGEKKEK